MSDIYGLMLDSNMYIYIRSASCIYLLNIFILISMLQNDKNKAKM